MTVGIMKNSLLYILYDFDSTLFVSMFCENKNRPQLHCNGKCQLAKMLKEKEQEDASNILKQLQKSNLIAFNDNNLLYERKFSTLNNSKHPVEHQSNYCFSYFSKKYKPPKIHFLS